MTPRDDEHIGHVPTMTPAHDEIASYQRKSKGSFAQAIGEVPAVQATAAGGSKVALVLIALALLATAAWAGFLHQQLILAQGSISNYELRISDLERRLSVTDESMSESSVAMKVKVRELDSEIRKLWDNVWKKTKARMDSYDVQLKKHSQGLAAAKTFMADAKGQLASNATVVAGLSTQLKKAEKMQQSVVANQQKLNLQRDKLDSTVDKFNRLQSSVNKMDKRVKDTEEWVDAINGFRRQVNQDLGALKQSLGQLQGGG